MCGLGLLAGLAGALDRAPDWFQGAYPASCNTHGCVTVGASWHCVTAALSAHGWPCTHTAVSLTGAQCRRQRPRTVATRAAAQAHSTARRTSNARLPILSLTSPSPVPRLPPAGHPLYVFRSCPQPGLAQGLLALPTLATAIAVATRACGYTCCTWTNTNRKGYLRHKPAWDSCMPEFGVQVVWLGRIRCTSPCPAAVQPRVVAVLLAAAADHLVPLVPCPLHTRSRPAGWWHQLARSLLASSFQLLLWTTWTAAIVVRAAVPPAHDRTTGGGTPNPPSGAAAHAAAAAAAAAGSKSEGDAAGSSGVRRAGANGGNASREAEPAPLLFRRQGLGGSRAGPWALLAAGALGVLLSLANAFSPAGGDAELGEAGAGGLPTALSPWGLILPGSVFQLPGEVVFSSTVLSTVLLTATGPTAHALARALPRTFTPGESAVAVQALLCLLAGSLSYTGLAVQQYGILQGVLWSPVILLRPLGLGLHPHPHPHTVAPAGGPGTGMAAAAAAAGGSGAPPLQGHHPQQRHPDPGLHVPAFVLLVLTWVLALAGCCWAACAGRGGGSGGHEDSKIDSGGGSAGGSGQPHGDQHSLVSRANGHSDWARGADVSGANGRAAGSAAVGSPTPDSSVRRRKSAASLLPRGAAQPTAHGPGPQQPRREQGAAWRRGAAVAGCCVSFLLLCDLALWVLGRFVAASSRPRLATLAYWCACLGATVPLMYCISKASAAAGGKAQERRAGQHMDKEEEQEQWERGGTRAAAGGGEEGDARGAVKGAAGAGPGGGGSGGMGRALLRALAVPHIVMRKGYHLIAILLFLPAFGWDARMLQASLAVAAAVLAFAEVLRCCGPPAVQAAIGSFMRDFADGRDSGPVYVTHFTLLLGIAVPVWLSDPVCGAAAGAMMAGLYGNEAAIPLSHSPGVQEAGGGGGGEVVLSAAAAQMLPSCRAVVGLCGLVALGTGDTAAACVGYLLGRARLFRGGKKTYEGTASGVAAMMGSWAVVAWWLDVRWALSYGTWAGLAGVTAGVGLLEAVTQQLDNVVVPLYYTAHLVLLMTGN